MRVSFQVYSVPWAYSSNPRPQCTSQAHRNFRGPWMDQRKAVRAGAQATRQFVLLVVLAGVASCGSDGAPIYTNLRIYESPYADVEWVSDLRLKAQHHDHTAALPARILAYDKAGYQVLSLMDYSGRPSADYSWRERIWPPESFLPPAILAQLNTLTILIPNAEEIGVDEHATSPFLTTYLEVAGAQGGGRRAWQYGSYAELLSAIDANGGTPCIAHPWNSDLTGYARDAACVEVYSAYAEAMRYAGRPEYVSSDRNEVLLRAWDRMLDLNERIIGIAVNDHAGPYMADGALPARIRDSGKIIVFARQSTLASYREAFERGAVIAIRDNGEMKDLYPAIRTVSTNANGASVDVDGYSEVRWVTRNGVVSTGPEFDRALLPANTRWVRAEVHDPGQSVQYLQAFVVRPVGDVDGDYDIDDDDSRICDDPLLGTRALRERNACAAIQG